MNKYLHFFKYVVVLFLTINSNTLLADVTTLTGTAVYLESVALPPDAVFEAILEDVSLMDVPAVELGRVSVDPAGQFPIVFAIQYDSENIKLGRRYNIRGIIKIDGKLSYITDTKHPVLTGKDSALLQLQMKRVQSSEL